MATTPHDLEPLMGAADDEEAAAMALEAAAAESEAALVARAVRVADVTPPIQANSAATPPMSGRGNSAASCGASSGADAAAPDDAIGTEAGLRYNKARLAVTLEELERLRALLAEKSASLAAAEASCRELQQKTGLLSRSERSLQAALDKERQLSSESAHKVEALASELSHVRRQGDESVRREKSQGAETRSKDVRLNRALEELERTRAQLRQLKDERDGAGQGARAEAQRLAAENTRLRKRQSELILAFKKQAKLIDVLKRQKLHVEAATLLSFTEEEFSKSLELGEQLALA